MLYVKVVGTFLYGSAPCPWTGRSVGRPVGWSAGRSVGRPVGLNWDDRGWHNIAAVGSLDSSKNVCHSFMLLCCQQFNNYCAGQINA